MQCKIDHTSPDAVPAFLCRTCHPCALNPVAPQKPHNAPTAAHPKRRADLPKTMDETAWAILRAQERTKAEKKEEALAKLKAQQEAQRAELGDEAYKALQRSKLRAKRAATPKAPRRKRTPTAPTAAPKPVTRKHTKRKAVAVKRHTTKRNRVRRIAIGGARKKSR